MALERKLLLERIELDKDDNLSVLLKKGVVDGDLLVAYELHRVLIPASSDPAKSLDSVSAALQAEGFPVLPAAVRDRVTKVKEFARTLPAVEKPRGRAK